MFAEREVYGAIPAPVVSGWREHRSILWSSLTPASQFPVVLTCSHYTAKFCNVKFFLQFKTHKRCVPLRSIDQTEGCSVILG